MKDTASRTLTWCGQPSIPFEATVAKEGCRLEDAIGISTSAADHAALRAKNYPDVPYWGCADYARVLDEMKSSGGQVSAGTNFGLAVKVFQHTAAYDGALQLLGGPPRPGGFRLPAPHIRSGRPTCATVKTPSSGGLLRENAVADRAFRQRSNCRARNSLQQHHRPGRGHRDRQGIRTVGGGHHQHTIPAA